MIVGNDWDIPSPVAGATAKTKYYGPDKAVQEKIKRKGRDLQKSSNIEKQLRGYGLEAYGHFYRSLECATEQARIHPNDFREYFPHWIYSDPEYMPKNIFRKLSKLCKKPKAIKIAKGHSYWKYKQIAKIS